MKEHRFHHVGFAVEITGTIVAASISQLGTGRDYSNIGVTFVSSDHRAFECKVWKVCYFCGRRNHHQRSLCETQFRSLENGSAQLGSMIDNYQQRNLNCSHDKEGISQENKSKRAKSATEKISCKLQILDSEDEV